MGKLCKTKKGRNCGDCDECDSSVPICSHKYDAQPQPQTRGTKKKQKSKNVPLKQVPSLENGNDTVKELVVIGAGPHALALVLRLLEPDPDFLTEKERHARAEYQRRNRPLKEVDRHLELLARGPSYTLGKQRSTEHPPPIELDKLRQSVLLVDSSGDKWLDSWKRNFQAIGISQLRSPITAHADPFDHRSLMFYAQTHGQEDELKVLPHLTQKDAYYKGPYEAPSTKLFLEYHTLLARAYGIHDLVQRGTVQAIVPQESRGNVDNDEEPVFRLDIVQNGRIVKVYSKRVVCALGPMFKTEEAFWERTLRTSLLRDNKSHAVMDRSYPSCSRSSPVAIATTRRHSCISSTQ